MQQVFCSLELKIIVVIEYQYDIDRKAISDQNADAF